MGAVHHYATEQIVREHYSEGDFHVVEFKFQGYRVLGLA
jgi:hypothetical protein